MTQNATEILEIKAAVRERDGLRCTECGKTSEEHIAETGKDLEVHRVVPGSPYAVDETCVTLCKRCHGPKPRRPRGTYPNGYPTFVRVYIPLSLYSKAAIVADYMGVKLSDFINDLLRPLIDKDWPKALDSLEHSAD